MLDEIIRNEQKIHTREITLATYPYRNQKNQVKKGQNRKDQDQQDRKQQNRDQQVLVHGVLKDRRYIDVFDVTGDVKGPGIIHHMDVKLLIKADPLTIVDAEGKILQSPMPECRQTLDTIPALIGLEIKSGFSKQIRTLMGGRKGCTHVTQLIIAMGQEIVHGWLTCKRKERLPVPRDLEQFDEKSFLIDSCRMWTRDGPKMKLLEQAIKNRHQKKSSASDDT